MRKSFLFILLLLLLSVAATAYAESNIVPIRAFLNEMGYSDDQITWDAESKTVLLDGHDFYSVPPKEDGKTYANKDQLLELVEFHKQGNYVKAVEIVTMIK